MSGDVFSLLAVGALLVGGIPVMIAGASALVGALGIGRAAVGLIRGAVRRRNERQLEVQQASKEMQAAYHSMQELVNSEAARYQALREEQARELQAASDALRQSAQKTDTAGYERQIAQEQKRLQESLARSGAAHREEIRRANEEEAEKTILALQDALGARQAVVRWQQEDAASRALQKTAASDLLRDARAALRVLEAQVKSAGDPVFSAQAEQIAGRLRKAEEQYEKGLWQAAAAGAADTVTVSARLSLRQERMMLELDERRLELTAQLEALQTELTQGREVELTIDDHGEKVQVTEDLNDFTQGQWTGVSDEVRALTAEVQAAGLPQLELLEDRISTLTGKARDIMALARRQLRAYYERDRAMDKLADFMISQNYRMAWIGNPGDDRTQEMAAGFVSGQGDTVTLILDGAPDGRLDLKMKMFYAGGRRPTAKEQADLRTHLEAALHNCGMQGRLTCPDGTQGKASADTQYASEDGVREQETHPVT